MSAGDTRMRRELASLPNGVFEGANRYDTDTEHVLHLWRDGQSWDIRVPKVLPPARLRFAPRYYTDDPQAPEVGR